MDTIIIHFSDIHFRPNWHENHGTVFRALFDDLRKSIGTKEKYLYAVFSGDIVQNGSDPESYTGLLNTFDQEFNEIGIPKTNRICVPGNHDICRNVIQESQIDHESVILRNLKETEFNNYMDICNRVFVNKFELYKNFEANFTNFGALTNSIGGSGYDLPDGIGIYCLNSAFFSSGGIDGPTIDKGKLAINTRKLHEWIQNSTSTCKILVMHHPLDWLMDWAKNELRILLRNDFALLLCGHSHDQSMYYSINSDIPLIELTAPPLFTTKQETLGYSCVSISACNIQDVSYRQWAKRHQKFVLGVDFSGNEDGKLVTDFNPLNNNDQDLVETYLSEILHDALTAFSSQPRVWVEPFVSTCAETDKETSCAENIPISDILHTKDSIIIKAPPQFGLTCLGRYIAQQAWLKTGARWAFVDSRNLKTSQKFVRNFVEAELKRTGHTLQNLSGVILDSWNLTNREALLLLKIVCEVFPHLPVIVLQTIDRRDIVSPIDDEVIGREFKVLHLWALSREHIRTVVRTYNDERHIGDDDVVIARVVSDIDTLNIHRTPLNCLTVLKASEQDFGNSPVNRTEMLSRVLSILFNVDSIPMYKTHPDMKDCEYVLGYFVEILFKSDRYYFTREYFIGELQAFCAERLMALDIDILFDILYENHIFLQIGSEFCFRFTYWLYYFAAQRMHNDQGFADFILSDNRYARFPEIMEFYTGIDRSREDAVDILVKDLEKGIEAVRVKCGLPDHLNPYPFLLWKPSKPALEKMEIELRDGVASSNLPAIIKDRYADRDYDRSRPYIQAVRDILASDTLVSVMLSLNAASRAIRNSDFVDPERRSALLEVILKGWKQLTRVLWVLLPLLSDKGHAFFDGINFILVGDFGDTKEERFRRVLMETPFNVVNWYKDDLYSPKMAPLFEKHILSEMDEVIKHELIILLIKKRPFGWKEQIKRYINENHKNSFYLLDVNSKLRHEYEFAFANPEEISDIEFLIKMSLIKHLGKKHPGGIKAINKMSDSILPERTKRNE